MEDRFRGLADIQKEILEKVKSISNGQDGNQNLVHVVLGSGSAASWILAIAFAVVLTVCIGMAFLYLDMNRRIDRMQDHLTAIYMQAPWLKPTQKEDK